MSQLTDKELNLVNVVLNEVESKIDENGDQVSTISSQENFVKALTELEKHVKQEYASNRDEMELEKHMLNLYNYIQQQLQGIMQSFECNVPLGIQLKCSQVFLRLCPDLWRTIFVQYQLRQKTTTTSMQNGIYPEWLLNELSKSLQKLISEDPVKNYAIISKFVKAIGNFVTLFVHHKLLFNSLLPLYTLHDIFTSMYTIIFSQKNEIYKSNKIQCQKWFEGWLDYLSNNMQISLNNNDNDDLEGNYLVFICKSILDILSVATLQSTNNAWKALLALTCKHPLHTVLIKKRLGNSAIIMDIPKMLISCISTTITQNMRTCFDIVQKPIVTQTECETSVKMARFYLQNFISVVKEYGEHILVVDPKNLSTILITSLKYALLVPILYIDKHNSSDKDYKKLKELLQSNMSQVNTALTATLSSIVSSENTNALSTFISNNILTDYKDIYDITAQVYIMAIILAKAKKIDEEVEMKILLSLFERISNAHAILLNHTECENSTLSPYQKIDNYLSIFYNRCAHKRKQNEKIQQFLWNTFMDLTKSNTSRQLALDSLTFIFVNSAQYGYKSCSEWIRICESMIDACSCNLFTNSDTIDEYEWLLWKECILPLLERFGLAVSDTHQFMECNVPLNKDCIYKYAVLPRPLIHQYLAQNHSNYSTICQLCISSITSLLEDKSYAESTGTLLSAILVLGNYLSCHLVDIDSLMVSSLQKLMNQIFFNDLEELTKVANYKVLMEMINTSSSIIKKLTDKVNVKWLDDILVSIFKWLASLWEMNNASYRAAIIIFISSTEIKIPQPSAELLNILELFFQSILVVPRIEASKLEWVLFKYTLEAVKNFIQSCSSIVSTKIQSAVPQTLEKYMNNNFDVRDIDPSVSTLFPSGNYFEDHMPSRKEEILCQKRKRELNEFIQRQSKKLKLARSENVDSNISLIEGAKNKIKNVLSQLSLLSNEEKEVIMSRAQQLLQMNQQLVNQLDTSKSRNKK